MKKVKEKSTVYCGSMQWQALSTFFKLINSDSAGDTNKLLQRVLDIICDELGMESACFVMLDSDGYLRIKVSKGISKYFISRVCLKPGEGFVGKAFLKGETIIVNDSSKQWQKATRALVNKEEIGSFIHIPIKIHGKKTIGCFNANSKRKFAFTPKIVEMLSVFAEGVTTALANVYKLEEVKKIAEIELKKTSRQLEETKTALNKKIKQLKVLHKVSETLTLQLNISKLLASIIRLISQKTLTEKISIMLVDKRTKHLRIKAAKGLTKTKIKTVKFKIGEGVAGWVAKEGKPVLIKSVLRASRFKNIMNRKEKRQLICVPLKVRAKTIGVINVEEKVGGLVFTRDDLTILTTIGYEAAIAVSNALLFNELQQSYFNTITALVKAMEAKEPYTQGHSDRVRKYALAIAREVNLSKENVELIKRFGALHDIGKIGIPIRILNKPYKLTKEEWKVIKGHPRIGVTIIETIDFMKLAEPIILSHHERYDGKGYPMKLRNKKIPLLAKIFAVADAYDAMLSERPYRKAFSKEYALAELAHGAGTQFDPRFVRVAIRVFKKLKG